MRAVTGLCPFMQERRAGVLAENGGHLIGPVIRGQAKGALAVAVTATPSPKADGRVATCLPSAVMKPKPIKVRPICLLVLVTVLPCRPYLVSMRISI